jgi:hypothetical protein
MPSLEFAELVLEASKLQRDDQQVGENAAKATR